MLAAERRYAILRALNADGAVRVADLAAELDVSEMTVRRDLDALDAQNLLRKVHGGAVTRHNRGEEPGSSVKAGQQRAEKAANFNRSKIFCGACQSSATKSKRSSNAGLSTK